MKLLNANILFITVQLFMILAGAVSNGTAECGSLGVMSTSDLPQGITTAGVRKCANHPLGHKRDGVQSLAPKSKADLVATSVNEYSLQSHGDTDQCYFDAPYGCSRGYCWKTCGPMRYGRWCWLAANNGRGDWATCTTYEQCTDLDTAGFGCGKNCKPGSKDCGCSC